MTNSPRTTPGPPQEQGTVPERATRKEWTALAVLMLPLMLVSMDVSVLYFAVPAITADLEPSGTQQLWMFDIYAFVLAGLLITMGSVGDRIGRRKLLLFGAAAFGAASVLAAYAQSAEMLIAARALLGIGGATLMPSTMALVRNMFRDAGERAKAIGIWQAVMVSGVALGSVMSGVLVEHFWWGSVFLVNLPAMALLLLLAPVLIPEFKDPAPGRFDWVSVPLSMAAVLPVVYGLKEFAAEGFELAYAVWVAVGLVFAALFVRRQRTSASPMISPDLFRGRSGFGSAVSLNLVSSITMMGSAYFTTQYLQSVLGKSAMEAALWALLPSVLIGFAAPVATVLVQRGVNRATVVATGFLTSAAGFALLLPAGTDSMWTVLVAAGVLAGGAVIIGAVLTDLAMGAAPPEKAGSASSLLETGTEFGGAMGMALLGSIGNAVYHAQAPASAPPEARETLGGAVAVAEALPGKAGEALLAAAREAFTSGMHVAATVGVSILLVAAGVAAVTLRKVRVRSPQAETEELTPSGV
ncbi:MFS transporter [Streptomyces indicus]|uniref:MFS transporter, DHA2 family, multidrug resistance protein n=1 Tax=Streptomyces indicus TaxID=417292 RepID=A0A1G8W3M6_9ACTN|nr:MFS transporter [Streptomyces indicus]SDJ72849.1 MFS transporter, DHA2 family, multidrug resistance protein [Streptomyces indicus]